MSSSSSLRLPDLDDDTFRLFNRAIEQACSEQADFLERFQSSSIFDVLNVLEFIESLTPPSELPSGQQTPDKSCHLLTRVEDVLRSATCKFYEAIRDHPYDTNYAAIRTHAVCQKYYRHVQEYCWRYTHANPDVYVQGCFDFLCDIGSKCEPRPNPFTHKITMPAYFPMGDVLLDIVEFDETRFKRGVSVRPAAAGEWPHPKKEGLTPVFSQEEREKGGVIDVTLQLLWPGYMPAYPKLQLPSRCTRKQFAQAIAKEMVAWCAILAGVEPALGCEAWKVDERSFLDSLRLVEARRHPSFWAVRVCLYSEIP